MKTFQEFITEATIPNDPKYIAKYIDPFWKTHEYELKNGKKTTVSIYDSDGNAAWDVPTGTKVKLKSGRVKQIGSSGLLNSDKGYVSITNLEKPKIAGVINLGDAAEGVVYAAMWLKHTEARKKDVEKIKPADIIAFIENIKWKKHGENTSFIVNSKNVKGWGGVVDNVKGSLYLKKVSAEGLTDPANAGSIKPLAGEAANMVNSKNFERFVKMLHRNEKVNTIEIEGLGPLDETGQKIDLRVVIDGKTTSYNSISLKRGSNQLGQKGFNGLPSKSFDSLSSFFKSYLNLDISPALGKYNELYVNDAREATKEVVKVVVSKLAKTNEKKLKAMLINSFNTGAFGNDNITIFDIQKGSRMNPANVSSVINKFKGIKIQDTSKTLGEMRFSGTHQGVEMEIAKIRFKFENEGKTKRIYFESSSAIKKLFKL
tara:strand:+ start:1448 stop:2734 length:1287 start_codon:yes stop_codon:yes gene_type:complete